MICIGGKVNALNVKKKLPSVEDSQSTNHNQYEATNN
jgi:hypothetical protein